MAFLLAGVRCSALFVEFCLPALGLDVGEFGALGVGTVGFMAMGSLGPVLGECRACSGCVAQTSSGYRHGGPCGLCASMRVFGTAGLRVMALSGLCRSSGLGRLGRCRRLLGRSGRFGPIWGAEFGMLTVSSALAIPVLRDISALAASPHLGRISGIGMFWFWYFGPNSNRSIRLSYSFLGAVFVLAVWVQAVLVFMRYSVFGVRALPGYGGAAGSVGTGELGRIRNQAGKMSHSVTETAILRPLGIECSGAARSELPPDMRAQSGAALPTSSGNSPSGIPRLGDAS